MKHPSQEDLLGYVLGALDAQEERDLQEQIDSNPEIEDQLLELRHAMSPMESLDFGEPGFRPGLARRTCELVAGLKQHGKHELFEDSDAISELFDGQPSTEAELEPASMFSRFTDRMVHPASLSRVDVLAGVAILAVFASILLPAISHSRFQSRVESCKYNIREVGTAMLAYAELNNAKFVGLSNASLASTDAGIFAPLLKSAGYIEDDSFFACAGRAETEPLHIPTLQQVRSADGEQLEELERRMGGHFGYALGFFDRGKYRLPRNDGSSHTILFADVPSADMPGRSSKNHNGKGQNCFFADGHVQFIPTHMYGDDAIYENDLGMVGPGIGEHDNVIAPSHVPPVKFRLEFLKPASECLIK